MDRQQFGQLKYNLDQHHNKCVGNSCTSAPLFLVRVKKIDWGYEEEYADYHCLRNCDWEGEIGIESVQEFMGSYDEEEWEYIFEGTNYEDKKNFEDFHQDLNDIQNTMTQIQPDSGWELIHGNERWETVNWFLTRPAAEEFVKAKGGDVDLNIWVDSLYRSGEFRNLLEAVANGELILDQEEDGVC